MILAVDIGNSHIEFGVSDGEEIIYNFYIKSDPLKSSFEYQILLREILSQAGFSPDVFEGCIVSSVLQKLNETIRQTIELLIGTDKKILFVGPGVKSGLSIRTDNPAEVGSDIVAGAVAAKEYHFLPAIVVDYGTATVFSYIDGSGNLTGCSITSGIGPSLSALTENTDSLPGVGITKVKNIIGKNTIDSITSGAIYGAAALFDGMIDRIIDESKSENPCVIVTGRFFDKIKYYCKKEYIYDELLVLKGLVKIYNKNK